MKNYLNSLEKQEKTIGFVPTMGALHQGHMSLLERAKRENDISVASIFVNPLQFNDMKDLEKYPRSLELDIEKIKATHCDVLFAPSTEEMYPESRIQNQKSFIALGQLDKIMEGQQRPGHFQGVCVVVKKLFDIIEPTKAYFGEKDFQQLAIIRHLAKALNIPVEIISCPTVREANGLAMSSRNTLLTTEERKKSAVIYKALMEAKEKKDSIKIEALKKFVEEKINSNPFLKLEYFEVVNSETLMPAQSQEETKNLRACIAVKVGNVRLIDNISF